MTACYRTGMLHTRTEEGRIPQHTHDDKVPCSQPAAAAAAADLHHTYCQTRGLLLLLLLLQLLPAYVDCPHEHHCCQLLLLPGGLQQTTDSYAAPERRGRRSVLPAARLSCVRRRRCCSRCCCCCCHWTHNMQASRHRGAICKCTIMALTATVQGRAPRPSRQHYDTVITYTAHAAVQHAQHGGQWCAGRARTHTTCASVMARHRARTCTTLRTRL
jgi:hypothetical protein